MRRRLTLVALTAALAGQQVSAQQPPESEPADGAQGGDLIVPGPAGRSDILIRGVDFSIDVDSEESKSEITYGGFSSQQLDRGPDAPAKLDHAWSIGLAVPFGGGDDLAEEDAFEAITDGIELTGSYSVFWFASASDALNDLNGPFRSRIMPAAERECRRVEPDPANCEVYPDPDFARRYLDDARVNRSLFSTMWRVGVEGSVGMDRFAYRELVTIEERKVAEPKFSAAIFGALYPPDAQSAFIGKVEYENVFEIEDDTVVCKPMVVDPDDDCAFGAPSAPENVERLNLSAEYRRAFELGSGSTSFAVAPNFEIDTLGGEWKAELPLYLILKTDLPILPGVSVAYESEKDELDIGVFLRASFAFD